MLQNLGAKGMGGAKAQNLAISQRLQQITNLKAVFAHDMCFTGLSRMG